MTRPLDDDLVPVIVAARRTPLADAGQVLADRSVTELAAAALRAAYDDLTAMYPAGDLPPLGQRLGVMACGHPAVDDVLLGNCTGPGGDVARVAALAAGLGTRTPGVSVDRQCGSGLEAIRLGAALVRAAAADLVLAGGAESASTAPVRLAHRPDGAPPQPYQRAPFAPPPFPDPDMGPAADALARLRRISRQRQDAYAARSHLRALAAQSRGALDAELVPVAGACRDTRPRAGLTVDRLARFRPAFAPAGTVTAGNSCGVSDGAAAVAIVPERTRAALGVPGLAVVGSAVAGVDPALPGTGPVPAARRVLAAASRRLDQVDVVEIVEAFAAQVLAVTDELGLDPLGTDDERVCPDGGALALGHPWGASGAVVVVRLFSRLVRTGGGARSALALCAVGGGQGVALLLDRVG